MNSLSALSNFLEHTLSTFKSKIYKEGPFDRTYKGCVKDVLDNAKYKVIINNDEHIVTSSIECKKGNYVWVCAPLGNRQNMFIVCKTK